ncbi:protein FREE1-like [Rutidosis leptorrhynchoides]|uniref:protein FREE1-like n=1 Tax=Rutidosis leptorrhynchoides TaxID=125765 RepID=UPI003A9A632F
MQQSDYTSTTPYYPNYPQNPNPNPLITTDLHHQPPLPYASAPPFATTTTSYHVPPPPTQSDYYPTAPSSYTPNPNPQFDSSHSPYQSQPPPFIPNSPYDHLNAAPNYTPPPPQNPIPVNNSSSFQYSPSLYNNNPVSPVSAPVSVYENSYETNYSGSYGRNVSDLGGGDYYGKRHDMGGADRYDGGGGGGYGEGVYAYQGGKVEPYGSRGTGSKSSTWKEQVMFDDFGRPIGLPGGNKDSKSVSSPKIVKAVPKVETREDVKGGVQKFRVKLLAESGGQSTMDVLCQIGLDGIRMLDPSTSRTLRIYSLDTITRCEVYDSSTFAFWSKSSVDIEPRRIRLQSNSYTTNTLLDTVTAATIQVKEMGGRSRPVDTVKVAEQSTEKKKGLGDWMNIIKPPNEEKDHWVPDEAVTKCTGCGGDFSAFNRKHHCRNCGDIFCDKCTHGRVALTSEDNAPQVRVCDRCMLEVTHRLSSAKDAAASRSSGLQSHEDLAKKLQEELERNHKSSSGSKSESSNRRMKEVACPTCTVHLQVQVPSSGSETIECGVCQHPFLVSAR